MDLEAQNLGPSSVTGKNVEFATAVRAERAEPPSFERLDTGARRAINDCLVRQWTPGTPGRASN